MEQNDTKQEKSIYFKEGIPGFEHLTEFILLEDDRNIFYYLQAVEDQTVVFPIINPYLLKKDYAPNIHESYFEKLGGAETEEFALYVIATIRDSLEESTVNLQAPLLLQVEKRIGIQAIVEDREYMTRHKIAELMSERSV